VSEHWVPPQQTRPVWQGESGQGVVAQVAHRQAGQWWGGEVAGQAPGQFRPSAGQASPSQVPWLQPDIAGQSESLWQPQLPPQSGRQVPGVVGA